MVKKGIGGPKMYERRPDGSMKKTRLKKGDRLLWIEGSLTIFAFRQGDDNKKLWWNEHMDGVYMPHIHDESDFTNLIVALADAVGCNFAPAPGFKKGRAFLLT